MASKLQNDRLQLYIKAERAVLCGQSYTLGNRTLTRANLSEIRAAIDDLLSGGAVLEGEEALQSHSRRAKRVVFRDF